MAGIVQSGSYANPRLDLGEAFMEYVFASDLFVGTQFFASMTVTRKAATFSKLIREALLRPGNFVKRAPKAPYERDGFEPEDQAYACVERGHEVPLDMGEIEFYANDFDAEMHAAQQAMWRVMYDQETDLASIILDGTTNFTVANGRRTDVVTAWSDPTAAIIDDVQTAKEAVRARTGVEPNTMLIGAGVVPFLMANADLRDAIKYTQRASIDALKAALGALLGLDKILIGKGVTNTAKKGQTASLTDTWPNIWAAIGVTANGGDSLRQPCAGRTLFWTADTPTETALIEEYMEPQTRSKIIRARSFADELLIDADFEQLLDIAA